MLPYTRWLDWCEVAYFVAERDAASSRMRAVLHALAHVPAREAQAKQAALRRAWPAFAFREGAAGSRRGAERARFPDRRGVCRRPSLCASDASRAGAARLDPVHAAASRPKYRKAGLQKGGRAFGHRF